MIFVSVGTTKHSFNRLLKTVDEVLLSQNTGELLVAQVGKSKYKIQYKHSQIYEEVAFGKMLDYFKSARVVVCHGGPATIFLGLKYAKNKPFVVPRLQEYKEHVNNHQKHFVKNLIEKNLVVGVSANQLLSGNLLKYFIEPTPLKTKREIKPSKGLILKLKNYCQNK